jgi:hypothetical protein
LIGVRIEEGDYAISRPLRELVMMVLTAVEIQALLDD